MAPVMVLMLILHHVQHLQGGVFAHGVCELKDIVPSRLLFLFQFSACGGLFLASWIVLNEQFVMSVILLIMLTSGADDDIIQ